MGWVRREGSSRALPTYKGVQARCHMVGHGRMEWTVIKASLSPEVPCPWLQETKDSHFPGCFGPHWYYYTPSTASQSKNTRGLGSKLLGGFPWHTMLGSWRVPWAAREVWRVTASFSFVLHPQEATWGKRGLTLASLVTNVGPRGLLSPLFEGKSGLGIEMISNCIFLSSWQFRVLRNGRTLHSFYASSKVLTPGFTQKIAHRK